MRRREKSQIVKKNKIHIWEIFILKNAATSFSVEIVGKKNIKPHCVIHLTGKNFIFVIPVRSSGDERGNTLIISALQTPRMRKSRPTVKTTSSDEILIFF